ncbi:MAG: hypothetical protein GY847_41350 [Proteobacteria bacterium]|nr:hypothetical protein [Pseudomonadota bacterium]
MVSSVPSPGIEQGVEDMVSEATGEMRSDATDEILVGVADDAGTEIEEQDERNQVVSPVVEYVEESFDEEELLEDADIEPVSGLMRPLFSEETIESFELRGMSLGMVRFLSSWRMIHAVASVVGIAAIVFAFFFVSAEPEEKVSKPAVKVASVEAKQEVPKAEEKLAAVEVEESPAAEAPAECNAFSQYSKFSWSKHLGSLIDSQGKTGICELFGMSPKDVTSAFNDLPRYGPTGYDLVPEGAIFEIYPGGHSVRRAPTIEFLFTKEKLFEIHLNYGFSAAKDHKGDLFETALGKPVETGEDLQDRKFVRYVDKDLVVEQLEKTDPYKRVFREIVFTKKVFQDLDEEKLQLRKQARAAFAKGMDAFNQRKSGRAVANFGKARKLIPEYGASYVLEGITLIRQEKFEEADELATKALEVSRDERAHAEAKGIQAVAALYKGSKDEAIALFRSAVVLDPTNSEFGNSVSELDTGKYRPERVAKTAARMSCKSDKSKRKKGRNKGWTTDGLLARGNFLDNKTYVKALRKAKKKSAFEQEYERWVGWECR